MAKHKPNLVLYGALAANGGIAIAKFIAAGLTGSSAMLTEGFHSVVDGLNEVLLLYGTRRSTRPADARHPFGYGRELYFWSLVVALLIFAVGAGFSIYQGVTHLRNPEPLRDPTLNYVVLAVAFAMESGSWWLAMRATREARREVGLLTFLRQVRDPSNVIVLLEDSAALIGITLAAAGILATQLTDNPLWDGAASIAIGLVLAVVAALLAAMSKALLIGEPPDPAMEADIRQRVLAMPGVVAINHLQAIHSGSRQVFVAMSVDFDDTMTVGMLEQRMTRLRQELLQRWPTIIGFYVRPEGATAGEERPHQTQAAT